MIAFLYFYSILDLFKSIFSDWFDRVGTTPSFKREIIVFFSEFEIKSKVEFSYNVTPITGFLSYIGFQIFLKFY